MPNAPCCSHCLASVPRTSISSACKVFYSVPSRLIGHNLRVHLYHDRLQVFLGATALMSLPRGKPHADGRRGHVVSYHHLIHAPAPQAHGAATPGVPRSVVSP